MAVERVILGVDPGSRCMGFGLVRERSGVLSLVEAGVVRPAEEAMSARLGLMFSRIAELLQQQLVGILADLSVSGSSAQQRVLSVLFEKLIILQKDTFFRQGFDRIITNLIQENLVKEYLAAVMKATVDSPDHLYTVLRGILQEIIQDWLGELHEDDQLQQKINRFLYDLTARSVLQAQSMIGDIIRSVLGRMTDQQLNQLVYDKVDTDLQWIRMNGSIVGAGIGLGLFLVLQMVQRFG